ncbi:hypothetical protein BS50DRAFT_163511 [Corynespora cassiicola Philippines]|uniref:Uncharacterized protein n=1 Tax=Corynespora cassiicola Philippines TaxID=1448308 RepID=A0A2T2N7P8_CORCC|nr:hypothetical protein BS50DRAFT_163511 [Corynespora cassiicola Philippines]
MGEVIMKMITNSQVLSSAVLKPPSQCLAISAQARKRGHSPSLDACLDTPRTPGVAYLRACAHQGEDGAVARRPHKREENARGRSDRCLQPFRSTAHRLSARPSRYDTTRRDATQWTAAAYSSPHPRLEPFTGPRSSFRLARQRDRPQCAATRHGVGECSGLPIYRDRSGSASARAV